MPNYKKLYAYLLGQVDDAMIMMIEGKNTDAYQLLRRACLGAEERYLQVGDPPSDEKTAEGVCPDQ